MAYKTKYELFIEDIQKRIPNVLEGFYHHGNAPFGYYKGNVFRRDYSFLYRYNECFYIELFPEKFHSKSMTVDKWNIVLWEDMFSDLDIILKHEVIYDENEIQKKVDEFKKYIADLPDD